MSQVPDEIDATFSACWKRLMRTLLSTGARWSTANAAALQPLIVMKHLSQRVSRIHSLLLDGGEVTSPAAGTGQQMPLEHQNTGTKTLPALPYDWS